MTRFRRALGYLAAAILLLSSAAHSFLGWKELNQRAVDARVPAELITSFRLGWLFGGAAMLTFGIVVIMLLMHRRDVLPVLVIGVIYTVFGIWALAESNYDPFFSIFIVPGLLLVVAGWPSGRANFTSPL
jgi:hypothetical protein